MWARDVLALARMRPSSLAVTAVLASSAFGCSGIGILHADPPAPPPKIEPVAPELPSDPPVPGQARVVLDVEGDQAKVSRVVATMNYDVPRKARLDGTTSLAPPRAEEPLCITPCALDLRGGVHTFVFTSTRDPLRSSTTDVVLPSNASTTFVRHSMGREGQLTPAYVGGAALLLLGAGLTLMGGLATGVGAFAEPSRQADGSTSNPRVLLVPGIIMLGTGVAMTIGGVSLMSNNRPVQQPGSTTTWSKAKE